MSTPIADPVAVRRAAQSELDLVAPLFDAYRRFYGRPSDPARARAFLAERMARGESTVLLARRGEQGVGFVQLYPSFSSVAAAPILILNDLFVVPEARRSGVATLLLRAAAEHGRSVGAARLTLSTGVDNSGAQALYRAAGWKADTAFMEFTLALAR